MPALRHHRRQSGSNPSEQKDKGRAITAHDAGLRYVDDSRPGITRRKRGKAFSYFAASGRPIRDSRTLNRIRSLAIPPAWTDVWICPVENGHLQATGRDARGRKQYRYHDRWRETRDANKFDRLGRFGRALGPLRATVDAELLRPGPLDRDKVLALVVRLLDETLVRVGNAEYAVSNESYGLTTLGPEHVEIHGPEVTFAFVGKGGIDHEVSV